MLGRSTTAKKKNMSLTLYPTIFFLSVNVLSIVVFSIVVSLGIFVTKLIIA